MSGFSAPACSKSFVSTSERSSAFATRAATLPWFRTTARRSHCTSMHCTNSLHEMSPRASCHIPCSSSAANTSGPCTTTYTLCSRMHRARLCANAWYTPTCSGGVSAHGRRSTYLRRSARSMSSSSTASGRQSSFACSRSVITSRSHVSASACSYSSGWFSICSTAGLKRRDTPCVHSKTQHASKRRSGTGSVAALSCEFVRNTKPCSCPDGSRWWFGSSATLECLLACVMFFIASSSIAWHGRYMLSKSSDIRSSCRPHACSISSAWPPSFSLPPVSSRNASEIDCAAPRRLIAAAAA